MKKIKIINGTYGFRPEPLVVECKTPADPPFFLEDQEATRLVSLGIAEYVRDKVSEPVPQNDTQNEDDDELPELNAADPEQEPEKATGHLDVEQLEGMDYNKLKKLAADMGVKPEGQKKSDYIAAIVAAEVEPGDEDDELPELNAVDPE